MLATINKFINDTAMYRLTLYGLGGISGGALVVALFGGVPYSLPVLLASLIIAVATAYSVNAFAAWIWRAPTNPESSLITACILFLIMPPAAGFIDAVNLVVITAIAIFSKYILAYRHRHIFNPAAFAAWVAPWVAGTAALWWVGSSALLPLTLVIGALIVQKIRRYALVMSCIGAALVGMSVRTVVGEGGAQLVPALVELFTSWPLVFMSTVMLTEPITTPPTRRLQIVYGVLVGLLFTLPFSLGPFYATPEFALVVGNLFAFMVSPKRRLSLAVKEVTNPSPDTYHFTFTTPAPFSYAPGQYMEWTLPHEQVDSRGIRRYFTIAAAPGEPLSIGVKIREQASSFKHALKRLAPGDTITAGGLYGDFVLPADLAQPLVWVAGGIGVTPFRAMTQYLLANNEQRDVVFFYCCRTPAEFDYLEIFKEAERVGVRTVPVVDTKSGSGEEWSGEVGFLTEEMLRKYVPDVSRRQYYLSGPHVMVVSYKKLLAQLGVRTSQIHTDYFPGF